MAWFNPFSWGGGPDEVNWGPMRDIANKIQGAYGQSAAEARGINFGVTSEDQAQYGASYGHMRDLVMQDLRTQLPEMLAQISGQAGARGMSGSSPEQLLRLQAMNQGMQGAQRTLSEFGASQAGLMQQGALQRGQMQLTRNQQLWQNLLQSYQPAMQVEGGFLQSEMDRIAAEKGNFGALLGGIGGLFAPGLGNLIGKIPGLGGAAGAPTPPVIP